MRRKSSWIVAIVVVAAGAAYARFAPSRERPVDVQIEAIARQDLEAIVSASGKVEAKRTIDISAETMGKVVSLSVVEGDVVTAGQPLLEIDPRNLETAVQNRDASLGTARSTLEQTSAQVENSRVVLRLAQDTLKRQQEMWKAGLIARDVFERAQSDVKMRQTDLKVAEQSVRTQEQRIKQEEANLQSARLDLTKVRIVAPMDGLVTRRNVEEGETAVVGTMNNAGTVLLTIADLSVIETEVEVDETDIPFVKVGQDARVTIDAIPGRVFSGTVSEVGNSPIQAASGASTGGATNFKVVVTIEGEVPDVRPGFTCTAEITTARRQKAVAVPIAAMTVRELVVDEHGNIVPTPPPLARSSGVPAPAVLGRSQTRKEFEGVFVAKDGRVSFAPVRTGIAGEKFFEVIAGIKEGEQIVVGPFTAIRGMKDHDPVTATAAATAAPGSS